MLDPNGGTAQHLLAPTGDALPPVLASDGDCPVTAGLREACSVSSLHPNPLRVTAAHAISAVTKQTQTFPHE
ncbi:hypothetical protein GCM10010350_84900 [Streptomyces galilaeus]|nr:hypothetical protein GCM10010350_84900 [Streptomyces galilaeus]